MPGWFRNEMLIALRARRASHRIASDIANPKLKVPPPKAPEPRTDKEYRQPFTFSSRPREEEPVPLLARVVEMVIFYCLLIIVLWVASNPRW
jgi:hypothetical protein